MEKQQRYVSRGARGRQTNRAVENIHSILAPRPQRGRGHGHTSARGAWFVVGGNDAQQGILITKYCLENRQCHRSLFFFFFRWFFLEYFFVWLQRVTVAPAGVCNNSELHCILKRWTRGLLPTGARAFRRPSAATRPASFSYTAASEHERLPARRVLRGRPPYWCYDEGAYHVPPGRRLSYEVAVLVVLEWYRWKLEGV